MPDIEGMTGETGGIQNYSDHRVTGRELANSEMDYKSRSPEPDDQDDEDRACACACNWRCSI